MSILNGGGGKLLRYGSQNSLNEHPAFQQVNLTFHQINIDQVRLDVTHLFWFVVQTLK